jgi:hypothetical protein
MLFSDLPVLTFHNQVHRRPRVGLKSLFVHPGCLSGHGEAVSGPGREPCER